MAEFDEMIRARLIMFGQDGGCTRPALINWVLGHDGAAALGDLGEADIARIAIPADCISYRATS